MPTERIGLMGGSFNPIHMGHYDMAQAAMQAAGLSKVLFIPSGLPPHKQIVEATGEKRFQMVTAAIGRDKALVPSRIELDRQGVIYSVDTLLLLKKQYPDSALFFIIGEDTLYELPSWRNFETVLKLCTFLVVPRPQDALRQQSREAALKRLAALNARIQAVPMLPRNISSTGIRDSLKQGHMPDTLSPAVQAYIALNSLYGFPAWIDGASPLVDRLFDTLSASRFSHSLSTCLCARELALIHGVDAEKALLAALLHDCAKCFKAERLRLILSENGLTHDPRLLLSGTLMHSLAGEFIAKTEYNIIDPDVLSAIACHTCGKPGMNALDMIIYLADKIEPGRKPYAGLETLRELSRTDLRGAVTASLKSTVQYLQDNRQSIHPMIYDTLDWLQTQTQ